jgi:NAD(P)-dependent dehydrogenase (short-subunit alcohol dehydrogenase family)
MRSLFRKCEQYNHGEPVYPPRGTIYRACVGAPGARIEENRMNGIAIVTGGSRGLGRSAVLHLARQGKGVIFTWRHREDEARKVVAEVEALGGRAASFPAFVDAVREALRAYWGRERIDALVNNAGHGVHAPFERTTAAQLDELFAVHVKGPFLLTQALLPLLADGGRIVNLSSGLARFALPGYSAYGAMKGAVEVLTRYLAKELGPRGITVNVIAPGAIATDFGGGVVRDNPQLNAMIASQTALGRVGEADDVGGVVASVLDESMRWVNGQRIEVSGGVHL